MEGPWEDRGRDDWRINLGLEGSVAKGGPEMVKKCRQRQGEDTTGNRFDWNGSGKMVKGNPDSPGI